MNSLNHSSRSPDLGASRGTPASHLAVPAVGGRDFSAGQEEKMATNKGLENWASVGEWEEAENTEYTGYDERCAHCLNAQSHNWNQHHHQVQSARTGKRPAQS